MRMFFGYIWKYKTITATGEFDMEKMVIGLKLIFVHQMFITCTFIPFVCRWGN